MDLWFTEHHSDFTRMSIKIDKHLYGEFSDVQRIDVFESYEFGRFLTLDGVMMMTEKDEFAYHEMLVHVPMAINPAAQKMLIIGAGDGGVVREAAKYAGITKIDMVEIDEQVVDVCRRFLPQTAAALDDPRLDIFFQDGLKFIRKATNEYDIIIVDSTDATGPGEGLFTKEFYGNCHKALRENGILVNQLGNPYYAEDAITMLRSYAKLSGVFAIHAVYQAHVPTYPSGHWLFGFGAKTALPTDISPDWDNLGIVTRYYNTDLHCGAFALPNYVKQMLSDGIL